MHFASMPRAAAALGLTLLTGPALAHDWTNHYTTEVPYQVAMPSGGSLNVRSGPGTDYRVVTSLPNGTRYLYLETCAGHASWCRFSIDGGRVSGWMLMRYVRGGAAD